MFTVLNGGCNTNHKTPFIIDSLVGNPNIHVLLILNQYTNFKINGENYVAPPNHAILLKKGTPVCYYKETGAYSDHWVHFVCSEEDEKLLDSYLPNAQLFSLNNPEIITNYLTVMLWENFYSDENYRTKHVDTLFRIILQHMSTDFYSKINIKYTPYLTKLQTLHIKLLSAPHETYNVEDICKNMGISVSYFQHIYKDYFGISFQNDLIKIRVNFSKDLLRNTDLTIQEIAQRSGYSSDVHFYRQFKKETGVTPTNFRKISDNLMHHNKTFPVPD